MRGHLTISVLFTLQIFCAWAPDRLPPNTVKSWRKAKDGKMERILHQWNQAAVYCRNVGFLQYNYKLYLTEYINQPAIDPASACHNAVTWELWQREKKIMTNYFKRQRKRQSPLDKVWCCGAVTLFLSCSMPKSEQRCSTNMSDSTKDSGSSRSSTRSLAVSLPCNR